ncbi:hypothetical protein SAMN04487944_102183 [Gracilibacillus ureilyticus]|uniref:Uncharacterized protein n=1 Tax=Gracilibacillus ureilyticus TaxID=531814 RepID=A0A1H9MVC3_9BACI|nr:hypothetical protein [Gracilibacillus ureilyticus]SER27660.1 hypothetical protein SAMN04487944_102183 [Gracilibacillus ureilyticus]
MSRHYDFCCQNIGRPVRVVTKDGQVHKGVIHRVNRSKVFLAPMEGNRPGGYGIGYYGYRPYGGYPWGLGVGIALGAIATIAFLPFFFW